jgi:hypothetical protein
VRRVGVKAVDLIRWVVSTCEALLHMLTAESGTQNPVTGRLISA